MISTHVCKQALIDMRYLISLLLLASANAATVDLTFTDNADNEKGFIVERSVNGGAWTQVATLGINVVAFSDDAPLESTVKYRVYAFNDFGDSGFSNEAQIITIKPSAPGNLKQKKTNPVAKFLGRGRRK